MKSKKEVKNRIASRMDGSIPKGGLEYDREQKGSECFKNFERRKNKKKIVSIEIMW